ncbi:uncharacterized protein LOC122266113 [Penaeus japonicus]|uniref:uncharacterized protein LOC122266113 n=1 Tax=Penaeus japonicus TaxID=27405 RepID=UPI001C7147F5|nr:uncharacterized protein LOC122266113 [Penaeus japonicus]
MFPNETTLVSRRGHQNKLSVLNSVQCNKRTETAQDPQEKMLPVALRQLAILTTVCVPACRGLLFAPGSAFGPVMVGQGKEVPPADAYATNLVNNVCECRMACWADPRCAAASALTGEDNSTSCRLSSKGPLDSTLLDNPNATYIFWMEDAKVMEDGLVYFEVGRTMSYLETKDLCSNLPGHRVPIFKSERQRRVIDQLFNRDVSRAFWVDLRKVSSTDYVWGDGTPFGDTEISASLTIRKGALPEAAHSWYISALLEKSMTHFQERAVCQANPFGVEW